MSVKNNEKALKNNALTILCYKITRTCAPRGRRTLGRLFSFLAKFGRHFTLFSFGRQTFYLIFIWTTVLPLSQLGRLL